MTTERAVMPVLLTGFDFVWDRLTDRLEGLSDEEYVWEARPSPVGTIRWRTWHLGSTCLGDYSDSALGDWPLTVPKGEAWFDDAASGIAELQLAWTTFRQRIVALGEDGLWGLLGPDWGPFAESTWADLVLHAFDEVVHHGAEIALLRDLWAHGGSERARSDAELEAPDEAQP